MTTSEGTGLVELPFSPSGMPGKESGVVWLMPLSVADLFVSVPRHAFSCNVSLCFWPIRLYKMAVGFMLAHPYGFTRVMSSYRWTRNFVNGQVSL